MNNFTTLADLIQRLRTRPVHVRRRVAVATSGVITTFIALAWFVASLSLGAFSTPATTTVAQNQDSAGSDMGGNANLVAGVAASQSNSDTGSDQGPNLTAVQQPQTDQPVTVNPDSQTVIPFGVTQ